MQPAAAAVRQQQHEDAAAGSQGVGETLRNAAVSAAALSSATSALTGSRDASLPQVTISTFPLHI